MTIAGGSIGYGIALAPRVPLLPLLSGPLINFQADGSALYTVQALWTQAREGLHVITVDLLQQGKGGL